MKPRDDRRVAMSDACKRARETGSAWVTWRGERLRLAPVPEDIRGAHPMTVVYVLSGRFRVVEIGMRKGDLPMIDISDGNGYRVQPKQLRAVVVERHKLTEPTP